MAKFAVALCILLVACGAQGDWFNPLKEMVEKWLQKIDARREEIIEKSQNFVDQMSEAREKLLEEAKTRLENAIAEIQVVIEESSSNVQEARDCLTEAVDLGNRAQAIAASIDDCAMEAQQNVEEIWNNANDAANAYVAVVDEAKANVEECMKEKNVLACAYEIGTNFMAESGDEWDAVVEAIKALPPALITYQQTLQDCIRSAGLEVFLENAKEVREEARVCLANLRNE